jgi:hypothetical protein
MQRAANPAPAVSLVAGALVLGVMAGFSCGALEPNEMTARPVPPACALVTKQDVAEVFGAPVQDGQPMSLSDTSYCTFRFVGRDDRVAISVTPQVETFARHAFAAGSAGEPVRSLGRHASWNENLLLVLHGATLYASSTSSVSPEAERPSLAADRDKHIALAQRALMRLSY